MFSPHGTNPKPAMIANRVEPGSCRFAIVKSIERHCDRVSCLKYDLGFGLRTHGFEKPAQSQTESNPSLADLRLVRRSSDTASCPSYDLGSGLRTYRFEKPPVLGSIPRPQPSYRRGDPLSWLLCLSDLRVQLDHEGTIQTAYSCDEGQPAQLNKSQSVARGVLLL